MGFSHDWWLPAAWRCCRSRWPHVPATLPHRTPPPQLSTRRPTVTHDSLDKAQVPSVRDDSPHAKAVRAVESMSVEERVGQLVMAPLFAGSDPSSLYDLIANRHVGSVFDHRQLDFVIAGVAAATSTLQSYAPGDNQLLMSTDQEGGLVQHLKGAGFDTMPSATQQGAMDVSQLRQSASAWGTQLKAAGINVDLAPVVGTVTVDRLSNALIGALYRDFGLDPGRQCGPCEGVHTGHVRFGG